MLSLCVACVVLAAAPDGGPAPRKQLGEQFGVPVYEPDQPWTREVPRIEGSVETSGVEQSSSGDGRLRFAADRVSVSGVASVEVAPKKLPTRRVRVQFSVERGRVRVFLKYALDVAVLCEAAAPATCTLEGVAWASASQRPMVLVQALDGDAVLRGFETRTP